MPKREKKRFLILSWIGKLLSSRVWRHLLHSAINPKLHKRDILISTLSVMLLQGYGISHHASVKMALIRTHLATSVMFVRFVPFPLQTRIGFVVRDRGSDGCLCRTKPVNEGFIKWHLAYGQLLN